MECNSIYHNKTENMDIAIVEGVMGYYDGVSEDLKGSTYEIVVDSVFKKMSDTVTPQGILCVVQIIPDILSFTNWSIVYCFRLEKSIGLNLFLEFMIFFFLFIIYSTYIELVN